MSIILNESKFAEEAIANKRLDKNPYETLRRVARYYFDTGLSKSQVYVSLEKFLVECDPSVSTVKWAKTIDAAVSFASKHEAININKVAITEAEMNTIRSLGIGRQAERLAFTLLCLSKYWNVCSGSDTGWVNSKDADIMREANIKTSIKRQCKLYHDLKELGLISFSKKVDCNNVRVNFANSDSPTVLEVDDFHSLGNQYLAYIGEPFFKCAECGIMEKQEKQKAGRKRKYCSTCAAIVKSKRYRNGNMCICGNMSAK